MKRTYLGLLLACVGCATLLDGTLPALAQVSPPLGAAQQFAVLGNSAVTGSTGAGTVVTGDVGSSPNPSISNFPPSSVTPPFTLHLMNDLTVQQAHANAIAAYNFLNAQGPGTVLPAQLAGAVLTSGIYSFMGGAADLANNGTLTLNGGGIFIFQMDSTLTANTGSNIVGTADPCNVYWRVGSSATLLGVTFRGNVIADASITVGSGSNVTGRVLAGTGATGAVTMSGAGGNTITGCASPPPTGSPCLSGADCASGLCNMGTCVDTPPAPAPSLSPWAFAALLVLLAGVAYTSLRRVQRQRVRIRPGL